MKEHMWVAMSYQPIEVELDQEDGETVLHTFTRDEAEEAAREEAMLMCFHCLVPLTTDSFGTDCSGEPPA